MQTPDDIYSYMQLHATELGHRICHRIPRCTTPTKLPLRCFPRENFAAGVALRSQLAAVRKESGDCQRGDKCQRNDQPKCSGFHVASSALLAGAEGPFSRTTAKGKGEGTAERCGRPALLRLAGPLGASYCL